MADNTLEIIEVVNTLRIEEENVNLLAVQESVTNILTEFIPGEQGEPGEGVPTGGVTGQILAKASNADFETQWVTNTGSSGIASVEDDPNPTLGGDLTLNSFNIIGQLENTDFILDGGLL